MRRKATLTSCDSSPYVRWQRTLSRLTIRYRKPYVARHTSLSWNLMVGRNPPLIAKQHGHRLTTMLSVYAAWAEGAVESDITAIREAMNRAAPGQAAGGSRPTCDRAEAWPAVALALSGAIGIVHITRRLI